jgi:Bifunctional DNA primase/polymerase, N-terminal
VNYVHKLAIEYRNAGISVIPLRLDGMKSPYGELLPILCCVKTRKVSHSWVPYCERLPLDGELCEWFSRPLGIGMVCGAVSGGLEVIDFDDGSLFEPWHRLVSKIVDRLPVIETPSGGWHVLFRCDEIGGNVKIACDPNREKQTLIETRGQGGYIVAEGSPCETHATGLAYCQAFGPRLPTIPRITPDERRQLWAAARTKDKRGEAFTQKLIAKQTRKTSGIATKLHPVIQAFNDSHSWNAILTGWTSRDGEHWTRPGKQFGVSARVVTADDGSELLTVATLDRFHPMAAIGLGINSTHGQRLSIGATIEPHSMQPNKG